MAKEREFDKVPLWQIIRTIKPGHFWALCSVIVAVITGAFLLGSWSRGVTEVIKVNRYEDTIGVLKDTIKILRISASANNASQKLNCKKYNVHITSPRATETVGWKFDIAGTCDQLPRGYHLWLFTETHDEYWPKDSLEIKNGLWNVMVEVKPNETWIKHYSIFIVGEEGQKLINAYKIGKAKNNSWVGINARDKTSDMIACISRYEVKFK